MSNKWIRKGDKVLVISGDERGRTGDVLARHEDRIIVQGLNIQTKHVKPKQRMQSGIVKVEGPMHISNVALCNEAGKAIKLKVRCAQDGSKHLFYKEADKEIVYREVKKKKD